MEEPNQRAPIVLGQGRKLVYQIRLHHVQHIITIQLVVQGMRCLVREMLAVYEEHSLSQLTELDCTANKLTRVDAAASAEEGRAQMVGEGMRRGIRRTRRVLFCFDDNNVYADARRATMNVKRKLRNAR